VPVVVSVGGPSRTRVKQQTLIHKQVITSVGVGNEFNRHADNVVVDVRPHQLAVQPTSLAYKWRRDLAPAYLNLCDELCRPANTRARRRLRSASSTSLDVRRTRLSTVGDRAFPVTAARLWNSLPSHFTAAPLSIFSCRFKSYLFSLSYPTF